MVFELDEQYRIVCTSKSNRTGFVHVATLEKNGVGIKTARAQYYNRTWECFQFQTVIENLLTKSFKGKDELIAAYRKKADEIGREEVEKFFKPFKALAAMADLLGGSQKEKVALKAKTLQAVPGVSFPDDFGALPIEEQERRINKALEVL